MLIKMNETFRQTRAESCPGRRAGAYTAWRMGSGERAALKHCLRLASSLKPISLQQLHIIKQMMGILLRRHTDTAAEPQVKGAPAIFITRGRARRIDVFVCVIASTNVVTVYEAAYRCCCDSMLNMDAPVPPMCRGMK